MSRPTVTRDTFDMPESRKNNEKTKKKENEKERKKKVENETKSKKTNKKNHN